MACERYELSQVTAGRPRSHVIKSSLILINVDAVSRSNVASYVNIYHIPRSVFLNINWIQHLLC